MTTLSHVKESDGDFERVRDCDGAISNHGVNSGSENGSNELNHQQLDAEDRLQVSTEDMSYLQSLWLVCKRSTPTILTMIFFQMVQLLNILFVGQMSSNLLAGVGLGNMLLNVLIFAITMGLNGTIESFVAWSFGQNQKSMCGIHLNRARIIVTVYLIPITILFLFMDRILIACAQDPEISRTARDYIVWTAPGWLCLVHFDCTKRFLQTIHKSVISTATQCITTLLHIGWGYLFIIHLNWGVGGAALALNITYMSNYVAQEVYIRAVDWDFFKEFMQPIFTRESFNWAGCKEFLRLGVPGTMMQCAEWWAFELLAIFAGILGTHQLAAQVAIINIIGFVFMIPLGIQFSASALVGGQVGAKNPSLAKKHAVTSIIYSMLCMSVIMCTVKLNQDWVASLFTDDATDIFYINGVLDIIAIYLILDSVHGVNTGIVRAVGKQLRASIATLCCYYIFGMPLAIIMGFKLEMGLTGFWLGFTAALVLQNILVSLIIVFADWNIGSKMLDEFEQTMKKIADQEVSSSSKMRINDDDYTNDKFLRTEEC